MSFQSKSDREFHALIPDNLYCVVKKNTEISQLVTAMIGPTNWPLPPEAALIDGFTTL